MKRRSEQEVQEKLGAKGKAVKGRSGLQLESGEKGCGNKYIRLALILVLALIVASQRRKSIKHILMTS